MFGTAIIDAREPFDLCSASGTSLGSSLLREHFSLFFCLVAPISADDMMSLIHAEANKDEVRGALEFSGSVLPGAPLKL